MTCPPLCVIQARLKSTRLPQKMLLTLPDQRWYAVPSTTGGIMDRVPGVLTVETLIARGYRLACEAFGRSHVVVAIPKADEPGPLGDELRRVGAQVFAWDGPESDVLGRFHACAHRFRWHPESVIVRYTPDDPFKSVTAMQMVAQGWRYPVEIGGEAFTLAMLDKAHQWYGNGGVASLLAWSGFADASEHITHAIFPTAPPPCPPGVWTIDTPEDLAAARERIAHET